MKIDSFRREYKFLSNFYIHQEIAYGGGISNNVETLYQMSKSDKILVRASICRIGHSNPTEAKFAGNHIHIRSDWDSIKEGIMLDLLRIKFNIPYLKDALIATGDAELIEGNTWGDRYWGVCEGEGENKLGILLMQVRKEICERLQITKEGKRTI